jgi:hypothetical protein
MQKALSLLGCCMLALNMYAQDSLNSKIKQPDFPFEPMYLDSNFSFTSVPLEKYDYTTRYGFGSAIYSYTLKGEKSELRLKKNATLLFVVNQGLVNGSVTNVKDMYKLFRMKIKKQKRSYRGGETDMAGVHPNNEDIAIRYKKVRDDIYLLQIDNLESGEYAIEVKVREVKIFTFGID